MIWLFGIAKENERETGKKNASFTYVLLMKQGIIGCQTEGERAAEFMVFQLKQDILKPFLRV